MCFIKFKNYILITYLCYNALEALMQYENKKKFEQQSVIKQKIIFVSRKVKLKDFDNTKP